MLTLELPDVSRLAGDVLDEVEVAVVGKRASSDPRPGRDPRRRPRAARGLPRPRQDPRRHARSRRHWASKFAARPVHPGSAAIRPDRRLRLRPALRRVLVPPGPAVHRTPARRRDQPHAAADSGRAARGDAGTPDHGGGRDVRARARRSTCWRRRTRSSTRAPIPLPEAQLDRFMMRTSFGYPSDRRRVGRACSVGWVGARKTRRCARSPMLPP